ncbi:MAG: hypothetical protein KA143_12230, partial [Saprospiraceae bacterium]|nr:hypothetical protein [Saprospiraceae bacterium]
VEDLVKANELTGLRDEFERLLLKQGKYLSGEIHGDWTETIKNEFRAWLAKYPRKTMYTPEQLDKYLGKTH